MTDKQKENLSFDQIELHSDIDVHSKQPPPHRNQNEQVSSRPSRLPLILMVLLFLAASGLAGYFYLEHRKLAQELVELAEKAASTSNNLSQTRAILESTKSEASNKQGSLQSAQTSIETLQAELASAKRENSSQKQKLLDLERQLIAKDKKLKTSKQAKTAADKKARTSQRKLEDSSKQLSDAREQATKAAMLADDKQAELIGQLDQLRAEQIAQNATSRDREQKLQAELERQTNKLGLLERQFKDESSASREILMETSHLRRENTGLTDQLRKLKQDHKDIQDKLTRLETVDFGDLVPFSESIKVATVRYREPLPDGVKIPKKLGKAVMNVLVNEFGNVEKAMLMPGQVVDATLSAALARTIYKWKFTPPTLNGVRVKTWQPMMIFPE